jgi:pilus assembly protein CpaB
MKPARLAVIGVAVVAGGLAALLAGRSAPPPEPVAVGQQVAPEALSTTDVLVVSADVPMGGVIRADDLRWQKWPDDGIGNFIQRSAQPTAIEDISGSIARQSFVMGEPMRMQKIIKGENGGFMSAILPAGMRAIATEISAETGAGGFILPNDRVDVLLTRREVQQGTGRDEFVSSTILTNVRVLAIDQTVGERDGQQVVVGRTATLELLPRQAEVLALARQMGTLSLALRALVDSTPTELSGSGPELGENFGGGNNIQRGMTVVRYGVTSTGR